MRWDSLPEYVRDLEKLAIEKGERYRSNRIKDHLPPIPPAVKMRQIQQQLANTHGILTLGAWIDCIHDLTCQLVVGENGAPYVIGE